MVAKIALANQHGLFAIVDAGDLPLVRPHKWRAAAINGITYAVRGRGSISMHRVIAAAPRGTFVDHKNGDGLDNRRSNLRVCSHADNMRNRKPQGGSSRFKGVWLLSSGRWRAGLQMNGKRISLGNFTNEHDAARAYDAAAISLYGDFAKTNESLGLL